MPKFIINYTYDESENKYVAACPDFLGFIIYCETLDKLKKESIRILKIYSNKKDIDGKDIKFVEKTIEKQLEL